MDIWETTRTYLSLWQEAVPTTIPTKYLFNKSYSRHSLMGPLWDYNNRMITLTKKTLLVASCTFGKWSLENLTT
jgi:hypothetical protein